MKELVGQGRPCPPFCSSLGTLPSHVHCAQALAGYVAKRLADVALEGTIDRAGETVPGAEQVSLGMPV